MSINVVQLRPQNRLANELKTVKHQLRALKQPQPIGSDVLSTVNFLGTGFALSASATLTAGSQTTFATNFKPNNQVLTLWNFAASIFVDVDLNSLNLFGGLTNTLNSGQKNMLKMDWLDWAESSDIANYRAFRTVLRNNDSSTHTYYYHVTAYLPAIAGGTTQ